ncbi:hypothetical protein EGI26_12350 [Lacihabitans sp. CCS-44]|uniref:hypothetical protein n=1 Tax=Lacihabitans sp. CCS-44 TaxID=2487331 RepID=UPI0020CFB413|nr:hypothetical protein [Lacihabitans sp. CCS-44]MCP9755945.1 hypothetical protein [Lacihabitans sp. CCS-44]
MTKFFKILFALIILGTSFSSLDAVACGKMKNTYEKKSCCKSGKKDCCKAKKVAENQKKQDHCGDKCNHPSCKCMTLITLSVLPATLEFKYDSQFTYKQIPNSLLQVLETTAGFYSNWQRPKIS